MLTAESPLSHDKPAQRLGPVGLLGLLALLSAFIPFSMDMYLPALPKMAAALRTTSACINLTLILFMVSFSVGTLLWGPLSDRYGRKPTLLAGLLLFTLSGALCAVAANGYQLVVFRILQGLSGGAAPSMATALVKDLYDGRKRATSMATIQAMYMLAPMIAPVIGAFLIDWCSWRGIFWTLALLGVLGFAYSLALRETVTNRRDVPLIDTFAQLVVVLRNPGFFRLLWLFSAMATVLFGYLAASSYVYIDEFGLSEKQYSFYFFLVSIGALCAPLAYIRLSRQFRTNTIVNLCFVLFIIGGGLLCGVGRLAPWAFALSYLPAALAVGIARAPGVNLMLDQVDHSTGSASALINCLYPVVGSLGMIAMSLPWRSMIVPLGIVSILVGVFGGVVWKIVSTKPYIRHSSDPIVHSRR